MLSDTICLLDTSICANDSTRCMQALSSACAKKCVRELRTENPSVSVFYLSWVTSAAAAIAIFIQIALGKPVGKAIPVPGTFLGWALFLAVGEWSQPHFPRRLLGLCEF